MSVERDYDPGPRLWLLLALLGFAVLLGCPRAEAQSADRIQRGSISTSPPSAACDQAGELGRLHLDTDADTDGAVYFCTGAGGWKVIGSGGTATTAWSGSTAGQLLSNTVANYFPIAWGVTPTTVASEVGSMGPRGDGTDLSWFHCEVDAAPGSGNSYVFGIAEYGSVSGCECTIADAELECADGEDFICETVGDYTLLSVQSTPTSTPTAAVAWCTVLLTY